MFFFEDMETSKLSDVLMCICSLSSHLRNHYTSQKDIAVVTYIRPVPRWDRPPLSWLTTEWAKFNVMMYFDSKILI